MMVKGTGYGRGNWNRGNTNNTGTFKPIQNAAGRGKLVARKTKEERALLVCENCGRPGHDQDMKTGQHVNMVESGVDNGGKEVYTQESKRGTTNDINSLAQEVVKLLRGIGTDSKMQGDAAVNFAEIENCAGFVFFAGEA